MYCTVNVAVVKLWCWLWVGGAGHCGGHNRWVPRQFAGHRRGGVGRLGDGGRREGTSCRV